MRTVDALLFAASGAAILYVDGVLWQLDMTPDVRVGDLECRTAQYLSLEGVPRQPSLVKVEVADATCLHRYWAKTVTEYTDLAQFTQAVWELHMSEAVNQ